MSLISASFYEEKLIRSKVFWPRASKCKRFCIKEYKAFWSSLSKCWLRLSKCKRFNVKSFVFATYTPNIFSILSAQAHRSRRMHIRPRMQKILHLWLIKWKAVMTKRRSVTKHGSQGFQGSSRRTHTNRKYFRSLSRKCKRFCIWSFQIQNLSVSDRPDQHFNKLDQNVLHFDAADQNPLSLIGFPVVGS
jgi:hypothetical protein